MLNTSLSYLCVYFLYNIFQANLDSDIVDGYYSLCQRLAVGLYGMESLLEYVTLQVDAMLATHERVS